MFNRSMYFIGGCAFIGLGYEVLTHGGWWSVKSGIFIYYDELRIPIGILKIIIGLLLLFYSFLGKFHKQQTVICPKCEEIVERTGAKEIHCLECGTKMEELKGFFERHPEKGERGQTPIKRAAN